jgi:uncharacterized membrane protein YkvA (DUF1232 family)
MSPHSSSHPVPLLGPRLPLSIERAFDPLCGALAPSELDQLRAETEEHVQAIRQAWRRNEFLDVAMAERLGTVLAALLDAYHTYPESHQVLIAGAARYFVREHDADPDTTSLLGLEDDVAVIHFVLDAIGNPELKVQTDG